MAETQATEQITAPPKEEAPVKVKDPRRVAAGKALAARNKAAREAKSQSTSVEAHSALTFNGIMQVAAVVGAGFTLYHGYQAVKLYFNTQPARSAYERPVVTEYVRPNKATTLNTISEEPVKNDKKEFEME